MNKTSMTIILLALCLLFIFSSCGGRREAVVVSDMADLYAHSQSLPLETSASGSIILVNDLSPDSGADTFPEPSKAEITLPERVFTALRFSYPQRVTDTAFRNGDWAVLVGDEWFYWANGRLLPEPERKNWEKYDSYSFYSYTSELLPVPTYSKEQKERLRAMVRQMEAKPARRYNGFNNALWRIRDKDSSWKMMKTIYFLGMKVSLHRELLEDLAMVEEEIEAAMDKDPALKKFVSSLRELTAYNWRPIAGTSSLSFHAYGTALDIIPKYYGGKQVYWRWAMDYIDEWFSLPYGSRYMPPASFIRAFENHGFVWGGKWLFYDTIHFEYRPEIFYLNDIPIPR